MKKYLKIFKVFLISICLVGMNACFSARESKPRNPTSTGRLDIPKHGITIDAKYDPRLDNLVPGYKIINLSLTNQGIDILKLNPIKDRWEIVDAYGKTQRAIHSMRISAPSNWTALPEKMKMLIEYPVGVSVGYSENIDLFFPSSLDLSGFRSISFYSAEKKQEYDILTNLQTAEDTQQVEEPKSPVSTKKNKK